MDADPKIKLQIDVLTQESDQLHDNIQRCLGDMNKLFGLAFPAVTGAFALALEGKLPAATDPGTLLSLFAVLSSGIAIIFNNVWMQLVGFTRYKYAEVLPRLYRLSGREGDNFGQHVARGGLVRAMAGAIVIQAVLLPVAAAAAYECWRSGDHDAFAWAAYFAIALAVITTVVSWREAIKTVRAVKPTEPVSS